MTEYDRLKAQRAEIEQRGKPTRAELVEAIADRMRQLSGYLVPDWLSDAESILALLESKGLDIPR